MKLKDIARQEIIGLEAEVIDSKNKSNIGIKGKIIDETRNTIVIQEQENQKRLLKSNVSLKIMIDGKAAILEGELLCGKPKNRIKK